MKPRFLPITLTLAALTLSQPAAFANDPYAQQQILQIQQQLSQQFPQQAQAPVALPGMSSGMLQQHDAQQQIRQINQQLQHMQAQPQHSMAPRIQPSMMPSEQAQMQQIQGLLQSQQMQQAQPGAQQMRQSPAQQTQQANHAQQVSHSTYIQTQAQPQSLQMQQGFGPSNSPSVNLPILNSSVSSYTSVTDVIPKPVGATSGVDILDESLKFHNQVSGPSYARPAGYASNQIFNTGFGAVNSVSNATVGGGNQNQACPPSPGAGRSVPGQNGLSGSGSGAGGQISTRAIGAIGAAALVGTFLGNGGVGGVMKSVGWDNSRHTRGMSIGGN